MSTLKLVSIPFSLKQCGSYVNLGVAQKYGIWQLQWYCGNISCGFCTATGFSTTHFTLTNQRMRFVLTRTLNEKIADAKLIISNPDELGLGKLECNFHFDKGQHTQEYTFNVGHTNVHIQYSCSCYIRLPTLVGHVNIDYREKFDTPIKEEVPTSVSLPAEDNKSTTPPQLLKTSAQLVRDLSSLLNGDSEGLSDAVLKCSGVEIPVHKCILAARSPVFAAMFRNKMAEAQNNAADIVDVEPDILRVMLKYIYCGQAEDIPDGVEADLLYAADKYRLEDLKQVCIGKLKSTMSVDNVFDVLVCGELHDQNLKAFAKEFICKQGQFSKLENMEQWKLLVKNHPGLAIEVLTSVVKHQEVSKK